jgi:hypothetical protein
MFTTFSSDIISYAASVSIDIFGVVGVVALLVSVGLSRGKEVLVTVLLSLYPAALVTLFFPWYTLLRSSTNGGPTLTKLMVFSVCVVVGYLILHTYVRRSYRASGAWGFVEVLVLALGSTGLALAVLYHIVGIENYYNFSSVIDVVMSSSYALFLWLVAPLLSMSLIFKR